MASQEVTYVSGAAPAGSAPRAAPAGAVRTAAASPAVISILLSIGHLFS